MLDFSQLFFGDTAEERCKPRPKKNSKRATYNKVPEAPVIDTVPDIGSFLSGGDNSHSTGEDDSLLDLHSSQWFTDRQRSEIPRIYQVDRNRPVSPLQVDERGDSGAINQDDVHYQIVTKSQLHTPGTIPAWVDHGRQPPSGMLREHSTYDLLDDIGENGDTTAGPTHNDRNQTAIPVFKHKTPSKGRGKHQFLAPYHTPANHRQQGRGGRRGLFDSVNTSRQRTPRDNIDTPAPLISKKVFCRVCLRKARHSDHYDVLISP